MATHPRPTRKPDRSAAEAQAIRARLAELIVQLQHIESMVIVCAIALKWRRCESDEDAASFLDHNILRCLDEQIRKAKRIRRLLVVSPTQR